MKDCSHLLLAIFEALQWNDKEGRVDEHPGLAGSQTWVLF
jgi:hypothetical protein